MMDDGFFIEPQSHPPRGYREIASKLEAEANVRLERFAAKALRDLGDSSGAKGIGLVLDDARHETALLRAALTRRHGSWTLEATREAGKPSAHGGYADRHKPLVTLKSQYQFLLDLPHRWSGALNVEFAGLKFLTPSEHKTLQNSVSLLSKDLTIMLMELRIAHLEVALNEEKEAGEGLRVFAAALSKELYCLSAISNALSQSNGVERVLTSVMETMQPILGARLGAIFFPAKGQCVTLRSPRSRSRENETPFFREYFLRLDESGDSASHPLFSTRSVSEHPLFPPQLKSYLVSEQIETALEFSLLYQGELVGFGILGFPKNCDHAAGTRLLRIALNMIGLFLQRISFMGELERQVKLISQEKVEIEKKHRFLMDHVGRPFFPEQKKRGLHADMVLDEMERARNMSLLAELASGVAHQIRNPLSNLLYALHLIKQDDLTEAERKELFESIHERVEKMNRMITEFVHYTRLPDLKLSSESLNQVLSNTLRSFREWRRLARVDIDEAFDPDLPPTRVDIFLLDQAFHNVIKNALEAIHPHGRIRILTRKLKIRHGPKPHLEFAEVIFEDNGPGIAPEDVDEVIKPFYSKKRDGMGLGLALTDHIIRAHGGAVNVENRNEGGTRVRIYLPIR